MFPLRLTGVLFATAALCVFVCALHSGCDCWLHLNMQAYRQLQKCRLFVTTSCVAFKDFRACRTCCNTNDCELDGTYAFSKPKLATFANMPTVIDPDLVQKLAKSFAGQPALKEAARIMGLEWSLIIYRAPDYVIAQAGFSFVVDHSGKLFKGKRCTLKDLVHNSDVPWQRSYASILAWSIVP